MKLDDSIRLYLAISIRNRAVEHVPDDTSSRGPSVCRDQLLANCSSGRVKNAARHSPDRARSVRRPHPIVGYATVPSLAQDCRLNKVCCGPALPGSTWEVRFDS